MAGLPGTGKSTLGRLLAEACAGIVLDKDSIRAALFPIDLIEYSTRQDDFCMSLMLQVASYIIGDGASGHEILDGRTFSHRYQVAAMEKLAEVLNGRQKFIDCVC